MNIFKFELKSYVKSIITWGTTVSLTMMMFMGIYPTFAADASIMDKMLANYPEELLKAMGMLSTVSLSSILGYYSFTMTFTFLLLAIQSSNYGFSILSVEESLRGLEGVKEITSSANEGPRVLYYNSTVLSLLCSTHIHAVL